MLPLPKTMYVSMAQHLGAPAKPIVAVGDSVKTGQVTYAVRDTSIDGKSINAGDIMGIDDEGIKAVSTDLVTASKELLEKMVDEDSELISIYYGADVKEEDAQEFANYVEITYDDCDVEFNYGGQPIYYYIFSVE